MCARTPMPITMNQRHQDFDQNAEVAQHNPCAFTEDDGRKSMLPTVIADGSDSSGCVSYDTVVAALDTAAGDIAAENVAKSPLDKHHNAQRLETNYVEGSQEISPPVDKKQTAWNDIKKPVTPSIKKPANVRKKNDALLTKFKFALQKYNKVLKTTADGQMSLKYMNDKLVKLREELIQSGYNKEEELSFDSPNFITGDGQAATPDEDPARRQCLSDHKKLEAENEALAQKLSELEQKNRALLEMVNKNAVIDPSVPVLHHDSLMAKNLRAKIKCSNAKTLVTEKKLHELKTENELLKKQLFESKTAADEFKVLHMQAINEIAKMEKEVEKQNEESKALKNYMSERLSVLKAEYETFQGENENFMKMVEELKQDYNESLEKCKEAAKTWEAINERYVSQKQMKDAIVSDFVKLGVSYKKLQSALEVLKADNAQLREQVGSQGGRICQKGSSYRCFRKQSHTNSVNKHVPRQRRVAVQTSEVNIIPVCKTLLLQQRGDTLVQQQPDKKTHYQMCKEKELKTLREENAQYAEKHKLLIRQVMRLEKQCHHQLNENKRQLKLVDAPRHNSKHLEEEVITLGNKHTEAHKCKGSAKNLPSLPSSSKTKRSKAGFVTVKKPSSKIIIPRASTKRKWLKPFWSHDNKSE